MDKKSFTKEQSTANSNTVMDEKDFLAECRACLQKIEKQTAYNLFESWFTQWAVRGAVIADDLSKFADVEITELDKFSKVICPKCYNHLSDACTFMITVQTSDSIMRQRVDNITSTNSGVGTSWPQPILLNKSGNGDEDNMIQVEVKQEVLSEDENSANMDQDWEPTMDIKIEPEEISAPVQSHVQINGAFDKTRVETTNSTGSRSIYEQDGYLNQTIKQEPVSGDELLEAIPDLPLDCMLCFKVFNSVSGLKAHVISQHSYRTVKRKAEGCPSPGKIKVRVKEYACKSCDQSFATSTDLMVHRASHSEHVCYVCDRKFSSFQQLTRHGPRCQKKQPIPRREHTRSSPKPQLLSRSVKDTTKVQKQVKKSEEIKIKSRRPLIEDLVAEKLQDIKIKPPSPSIEDMVDEKVQDIKNELRSPSIEHIVFEKVQDTLIKQRSPSIKDIVFEKVQATTIKPRSPSIEDMVVERVQELVKTWPSTDEMDMDSPQTPSANELESKVEIGVQEQQNLGVIRDKPADKDLKNRLPPEDIEKQEPMKKDIEINPSIEKIQVSAESKSELPKQDIEDTIQEQPENRISKPEKPENRLPEPEEETNMKQIQKQPQNESSNDQMEINPKEEIQGETNTESQTGLLSEDLRIDFSQKDCGSENITSISTPESTTYNSSQNINLNELSLEIELLKTIDKSILRSDPVPNLPNQDNCVEKSKSTSSENIQEPRIEPNNSLNKETDPSIGQKTALETASNKNDENMFEGKTPIVDEISEMKVHLEINQLKKDTALFETEMDLKNLGCGKSETCEPK